MQLDELTNDAKYLISSMYKSYIEKREAGECKRDASSFGSEFDIKQVIMSEWQQADIHETVNELSRARLLNVRYGSNVAVTVSLSTDAIVLMEHKFKNKMDTVIDYAVKIKSLISF